MSDSAVSDALPRLLVISAPLDQDAAAETLAAALASLAAGEVAALLLRGGGLDDGAFAGRIAPLVPLAQDRDIAVLLEDRPELLAASGADGLHVAVGEKRSPLKDLRRRFGDGIILGAGCGASRHAAMTAGEQGADYIGFGDLPGVPDGASADPETLAWWEALMTPPQVAFGASDLDGLARLAAAGPDFVALGPALWPGGGDPAAALKAIQAALAATA
ncbi:thiamine phosphate synthase [Pelagibius sp. 7325]|uniref:thiamine phosphate synthase n=1 Tax=Pelagibius sp. 7325 TaxID=3131994 RepID=UPI0030EE88A4